MYHFAILYRHHDIVCSTYIIVLHIFFEHASLEVITARNTAIYGTTKHFFDETTLKPRTPLKTDKEDLGKFGKILKLFIIINYFLK